MPTLTGSNIKLRKGAQKAQAKYTPELFRDAFVKEFADVNPTDYDGITNKLINCGNVHDYHRYGDALFELLYLGRLILPGGLLDKSGTFFNISIANRTDDAEIVKVMEVLIKVIRRYKYLGSNLEEVTKNILQYLNRWGETERHTTAVATGYALVKSLVPASGLAVLSKDHLIKDSISLNFLTTVMDTYLKSGGSIEPLANNLRKSNISSLLEFFPPNMRLNGALETHFNNSGLNAVTEYYTVRAHKSLQEELYIKLATQFEEKVPVQELTEELVTFRSENSSFANETISDIIWNAMVASLPASAATPEVPLLALLKSYNTLFKISVDDPKLQIALLNRIQLTCYESPKLMKSYPKIVQYLYGIDLISEEAVLFWYTKGARQQGKAHFIKMMETFVKWLEEAESEDDEDDQ